MNDLYVGLIIMILVCAVLSVGTWYCAGILGHKGRKILTIISFLGVVCCALFFTDAEWIALILPAAGLPMTGNFLPIFLTIFAIFIARSEELIRWRRILLIVVLGGISVASLLAPLFNTPPHCGNHWENGVCIQSTPSSCSPAAAATLLAAHGIVVTEGEMARKCLMNESGTTLHGLIRGVDNVARAHGKRVRFMSRANLDDIRPHLPAILRMRLDASVQKRDPRYADEWSWTVGVPHAVVLFAVLPDGRLDIGDPGIHREVWDGYSLNDLWQGTAIFIEK